MDHDWIVIGLGCLLSIFSWLLIRFIGHVDALEKAVADKADQSKVGEIEKHTNRHSEEIRDTRSAISRIEGKLDLPPFPYSPS